MILETKRLILRKPRISDWKDLVEGIGNLAVSKNFSSVPYPYKKRDAEDWIKKTSKSWKEKKKSNFLFVIELKSEKKVIGIIGIVNYKKDHGICETVSGLNEKYWRKGYITEAKIALNEFAFNNLKVRKMETQVYTKNIASNATQKRMGYKLEGIRKKHHISKATGKVHDENIYGLFKKDWKKELPKLKKYLEGKIKKLEVKK